MRPPLLLQLLLSSASPSNAATAASGGSTSGPWRTSRCNMTSVAVGPGGYPRGVQLSGASGWLICVGMVRCPSPPSSPCHAV